MVPNDGVAGGKPTVYISCLIFSRMSLGVSDASVERESVPLSKQIVMIHHERSLLG